MRPPKLFPKIFANRSRIQLHNVETYSILRHVTQRQPQTQRDETMTGYTSKDELTAAWVNDAASEMVVNGSQPNRDDALAIARIMVRTLAVYVPHLYRGGWVIRGFGYSVERIGKYINQEVAGNPALV